MGLFVIELKIFWRFYFIMDKLFESQISGLRETHFLILYWSALAEEKGIKYNITNVFDDLKYQGITRTKQSAVSYVDSLHYLCFIRRAEESNRKNIYISVNGAKALEYLVSKKVFQPKESMFLEVTK